MALKFHYNKITIQQFKRQLAIRQKALPILKNKETALRQEVEVLRETLDQLRKEHVQLEDELQKYERFWSEFPRILTLRDLGLYQKSVVGVKVPEIKAITFHIEEVAWWYERPWVPGGIAILKQLVELDIRISLANKQVELLHDARKKTTQKVNLYEKVQIPQFEEAILKIKRFLEDGENISKAAQKIMKKRHEKLKEAS